MPKTPNRGRYHARTQTVNAVVKSAQRVREECRPSSGQGRSAGVRGPRQGRERLRDLEQRQLNAELAQPVINRGRLSQRALAQEAANRAIVVMPRLNARPFGPDGR